MNDPLKCPQDDLTNAEYVTPPRTDDFTLFYRRKPGSGDDRPIFQARLFARGRTFRRSCRTRIRLSAEQAAAAWLKHFQRNQ